MVEFHTRSGRCISPFQIYIRCAGRYGVRELPKLLGLNYKFCEHAPNQGDACAIVCEVDGWLMLGDDVTYTLWRNKELRSEVARVASQYDVFMFSVGDCDRSFDFVLYRDGKLLREIQVESPQLMERVLSNEYGDQLDGKMDLREIDDVGVYIGGKASRLGIRCPNANDEPMFCRPRWSLSVG